MAESLKVLLVSPLPPPVGGIARWTENILEYAAGRPEVKIRHLDSAVRERGVHDLTSSRRVVSGLSHGLTMLRALTQQLREERPDVVHLTTSGSLGTFRDLALIRECRKAGVPIVYHVRFGRLPLLLGRGSWEARALRAAVQRVDTTLVLDERSKLAVVRNVPNAVCISLPNAIGMDILDGVSSTTAPRRPLALPVGPFVLFAGHVTKTKGITDLLVAWSKINASEWSLVIAGSTNGQYPNTLISQLDIDRSVAVIGELSRPEMQWAMSRCEIFVLPSHTEGFPNAVVEAMAHGRAVVATDVGAVPEMLSHGSGVVVPVGDVATLASALSTLINDTDRRRLLSSSARHRAHSCYDIGTVFSRYVELWTAQGRETKRGGQKQ